MSNRAGPYPDHGDPVLDEAKPALKRPPRYAVLLINDDFTPMDFVVHVLEAFFGMTRGKANRVMMQVHTQGKATCGVYSREIAETKAAEVNGYARKHQHPLLCTMEPV